MAGLAANMGGGPAPPPRNGHLLGQQKLQRDLQRSMSLKKGAAAGAGAGSPGGTAKSPGAAAKCRRRKSVAHVPAYSSSDDAGASPCHAFVSNLPALRTKNLNIKALEPLFWKLALARVILQGEIADSGVWASSCLQSRST